MQERRRYQRLVPDSPLFVRVDGVKGGRLLDMSEGGLALAGSIPKVLNRSAFPLTFDLPDGSGLIQALAEIAWTTDKGDRTGLRFVQLADSCRQQLRDWVVARAHPIGEDTVIGIPPPLSVEATETNNLPSETSVPMDLSTDQQIRRTARRHPMEIALAAIFLCSAFVCIGYYLPNIGGNLNSGGTTSLANNSAAASREFVAPVSTSTAGSTVPPPRLSLDLPGYVVQVGAMTHEDNADSLAVTLNRMNFPAFVFRPSGDRFYRVVVGPYGDENSTIQMKALLEHQGFQTILRRWSPE